MKLPRRQFLRLAAGAATLPAAGRVARAQAYPARPVHLISTFAAGGPNDITARLIGQWLSERLGQAFVVENRPGAGSNTATELVARGAADGYTLLVMTSANTINATRTVEIAYRVRNGTRFFDSYDEFDDYVSSAEYESPVDGITLLQEYLRAAVPRITRAEFVDGEFIYAITADTALGGFQLCPADAR